MRHPNTGTATACGSLTRSDCSALPKVVVLFVRKSWSLTTDRNMRIATSRKNPARPALPICPDTTVGHQIHLFSCSTAQQQINARAELQSDTCKCLLQLCH